MNIPTLEDYEAAGDPRITPVDEEGHLLDGMGHVNVPDPDDHRNDRYIVEGRDGWIIRGVYNPDMDVVDPDGGDHAFIHFDDPGHALYHLLGEELDFVECLSGFRVVFPRPHNADDGAGYWHGDFLIFPSPDGSCWAGYYQYPGDGMVPTLGPSVEAVLAAHFRGEEIEAAS